MLSVRRGRAGILPLLVVGCDLPFPPGACTSILVPAIIVEMRDARTGAPLAGLAVGTVRDGAYIDSLRPHSYLDASELTGTMLSRQAAHERSGRYTVEVERPGYQRWTRSDVRVRDADCHVQTQTLRAQLQAIP